MKVLLIDGKKLGVTIILVGLMIIMFGFSKQMDGGLRYVALIQNDMTTLKTYNVLGNKLIYKLPSDWKTNYEKFDVSEILYHNNFTSKDGKISGIVELWNTNENIEEFIKRNKVSSEQNNKLKDYSLKKIKINNNDGYLVTYDISSNSDTNYFCTEYFIRKDNELIRASFFVIESNLKENMPTIFRAIVETFKYNS